MMKIQKAMINLRIGVMPTFSRPRRAGQASAEAGFLLSSRRVRADLIGRLVFTHEFPF